MPTLPAKLLQPAPIDVGAEPPIQVQPIFFPLVPVMGFGVEPKLKGVHRGHPGKQADDVFVGAGQGAQFFRGGVEFLQVFTRQALHPHRSHFAEFHRSVPIEIDVHFAGAEIMESMTAFVQQSENIVIHPHRIHENERKPHLGQSALIASRGFTRPVFQIHQAQVTHFLVLVGQIRIQPLENPFHAVHQFLGGGKWSLGRPSLRIAAQVPRA